MNPHHFVIFFSSDTYSHFLLLYTLYLFSTYTHVCSHTVPCIPLDHTFFHRAPHPDCNPPRPTISRPGRHSYHTQTTTTKKIQCLEREDQQTDTKLSYHIAHQQARETEHIQNTIRTHPYTTSFFLRILPGAYIPQSSQSYSYPALKRLPPGPAPGQRRPEDIDKHIIEHRHRKIPMLERPATGALSRPGRLQAPESTLRRSLPHSPRLESKDTHDCTRTSGLYDRGISADTHRVFRPKAHWQND